MPIFQYEIIVDKKKKKGMVAAENILDAQALLVKKTSAIIKIEKYSLNPSKFIISKKELLIFSQELARLLHAGLTLYESLIVLCEKYENHSMQPLFLDLCDKIREGILFSKALSSYEKIFDIFYCSMVANAEKSGSLEEALQEIVAILKKQGDLKKKIIDALLYPSILAMFCFVVLFSLFFFVIPSLFELFEGRNIHPLTKIILSLSNFFYTKKTFIFFGFSFFVLGIIFFIKKIKKLIFYLPFLKSLLLKFSIIRFSRSFSLLLRSGISYTEALSLSKKVVKSPILQKEITFAEKNVIQGERLSTSFRINKIVPSLMVRLLDIAEESSRMPSMLEHLSSIYEEELEEKLSKLTQILQPLMLLILGIVVGIIVLSVLLPLTDVNSFVG